MATEDNIRRSVALKAAVELYARANGSGEVQWSTVTDAADYFDAWLAQGEREVGVGGQADPDSRSNDGN